uniref:snRNA-activating protein complex subunit 4 n=1 Tax=Ascaris lumbricoides TaxID=6252 RepID=A0A0M3I2Z8_ASCLU
MEGNERYAEKHYSLSDLGDIDRAVVASKCYMDFLWQLLCRVDAFIAKNRQEQASLKRKIKNASDAATDPNKKWKDASCSMFIPPYFRDLYGMAPQPNEEELLRRRNREYDTIVAEEIRWNESDLRLLRKAVKNSLIQARIMPRDLYREKLYDGAGQAAEFDVKHWKQVVASMDRRIAYIKQLDDNLILQGDYNDVDWLGMANITVCVVFLYALAFSFSDSSVERQLDDNLILQGDYNDVDWLGMANITFRNTRTARQLRLKWLNEQCPRWSKEKWSHEELQRLVALAGDSSCITLLRWDLVADELGTDRSPFQCFSKLCEIKEDIAEQRPWTKEEDARLIAVVTALQNAGRIWWRKGKSYIQNALHIEIGGQGRVASFVDGRGQRQCYLRYLQSLDKRYQRGNWTESEELLLRYAVNEFGICDWNRISSVVGSRNRMQCRTRYVNNKLRTKPWTPEEDQILLAGVKRFGEGQWKRVAELLRGRSYKLCRTRFRVLRNAQIEAKLYEMNVDEVAQEKTLDAETEEIVSRMPDKQRAVIKEAISEMGEKAEHLNRSFSQVIRKDMRIREEYLDDESLQLLKKHYDRALRQVLGLAPSHRYVHKLMNLKDRKNIHDTFARLGDDQARKKFMMSALRSIVHQADVERFRAAHLRLRKLRLCTIDYRFFKQTLVDEVLDSMETEQSLQPLPPSGASVALMECFKNNVPFLRDMCGKRFSHVEKDSNDGMLILDIAAETKSNLFYKYIAAQLRRLLFIPLLMDRAVEKEESWRERMRLRDIAKNEIADRTCRRAIHQTTKHGCCVTIGMPGLQTGCTNLEGERSAVAQQSELSAFLHSMRNRPGKGKLVPTICTSAPEGAAREGVKKKAAPPRREAKRRRIISSTSEDDEDIDAKVEEISDEEEEGDEEISSEQEDSSEEYEL